ncbi:MAG: hypothetical protein ACYTGN_12745 [Planctomycetota bacterium]|jgi:tetratricopeptide (TPR) repeat protein
MLVRCDECGATSSLDGLFVREAGLQRMDELHCPECHEPHVETTSLPGWPGALVFLGLAVYAVFFNDAAWPYLLLVLFPAMTIVHELLHAIPAWLLGARVLEIHVGGGKRPSWRIGGVRFAVTNWLVGGGHCAYVFKRAPVPLWRHAVVTGLPLFFHLCFGLTLFATGLPDRGEGTPFQMFALINAFIFLENIYPSGWSDGHHLFMLARKGRAWADARSYSALAGAAFQELEEGHREAAVQEARKAEAWMPNPFLGRSLFSAYLQAHAFDDAERFLEYTAHVDDELKPDEERSLLGHGYLVGEAARWQALTTLRVYQGRLDEALDVLARWSDSGPRAEVRPVLRAHEALVLLELGRHDEADRAGREAYADMPWLPLVQLVHGAVLVARGAHAGGIALLDDVREPYKATAAAWRAIGLAGLGRTDEARTALQAARNGLGAPESLLARAGARIEGAS